MFSYCFFIVGLNMSIYLGLAVGLQPAESGLYVIVLVHILKSIGQV